MNKYLSNWYHHHPENRMEWFQWILDTGMICLFALQISGTFLELNTDNNINPIYWTLTSYTFKNFPIVGILYPASQIPLQGNHWLTFFAIQIVFFYLLFKLDLEPFWIGIIILWATSIHEWFWYISDYIYYIMHGIYFNIQWIQGALFSWIELFIMVFIFPFKFKVLQKRVLTFIGLMTLIYLIWNISGFAVSYDYSIFTNLNNIPVHGNEVTVWYFTLLALVATLPIPYELHIRKQDSKIKKWLSKK